MDAIRQKPAKEMSGEEEKGSTSTVDLSFKCQELVSSRDSFMKELITVSPTCALYNWVDGEWKEMGTQSPLAIYHRYDVPLFSLMVCPEEEAERMVLPIRAGIKLVLEGPHIRVHKGGAPTIAIWLADDEECKRIYHLLKRIRKRAKEGMEASATLTDVKKKLESLLGEGHEATTTASTTGMKDG